MTSALPHPIKHRLQQTLAQWPRWQCAKPLQRPPEFLQILSGGISNFSALVGADQRFVVRIDGVNPGLNGLNRQAEWRALHSAYRAGIAPCPRYFNPDLGSLVCDYLEPEPSANETVSQVAALLAAIHSLPARHHRMSLGERITRYEKQRALRGQTNSALDHCRQPIRALLKTSEQRQTTPVLCHNDLLRANRIVHRGSLWAIDWEYCAMGDPLYDLAVVIEGDSLTRQDANLLVKHYLGRQPDQGEREILLHYGYLYRYLEILWYVAQPEPLMGAHLLREKTAALLEELPRG